METPRRDGRILPEGKTLLVAALLAVAVASIYGQTLAFPFIDVDDVAFLLKNPQLQGGFSWESVRWAVTTREDAGWIPVTWLSRLVDLSLFGANAGMHHGVNALVHFLNAFLLFLLLRRTTGRPGTSAFAAFLFAVHPVQTGTVAWVTERKELLASFFALLSLHAYGRYARRPAARPYAASFACFLLSLLSKPSSVPLPFLMLLLDAWPLGRLRSEGRGQAEEGGAVLSPPTGPGGSAAPFRRLLLEKVPFLLLAAVVSVGTILDEKRAGAVIPYVALPFAQRLGNALLSYGTYLWKAAWPARIAFFYPHPEKWLPGAAVALSAAVLAAVTAGCAAAARRTPWLPVGWLWFLGMLVPTIGIVQAGVQGLGIHYLYFPLAGLCVVAAWGGDEAATRLRASRKGKTAAAAAVVLLLAWRAHGQTGYWRDSETLFRHSLAVTGKNWFLQDALGTLYFWQGRHDEAIPCFRDALAVQPDLPESRGSYCTALEAKGRLAEAESAYREGLRIRPESADFHYGLGALLVECGREEEGAAHLREAIRSRPAFADAHRYLATALSALGRPDEAVREVRASIALRPESPEAHNNLGTYLARRGDGAGAAAEFREALRLRPGYEAARRNLDRVLADPRFAAPPGGTESTSSPR